jgi:hypothetical protein
VAIVSLRPDLLHQYKQAHDPATLARLFGFPETAVAAYVSGSCLELADQEDRQEEAGLPPDFTPFAFSDTHWRQELAVLQYWVGTLTAYGLAAPGWGRDRVAEASAA